MNPQIPGNSTQRRRLRHGANARDAPANIDGRPLVEALLALLRRAAPELLATLDAGEVPEGDWKAAVTALVPRARVQMLEAGP